MLIPRILATSPSAMLKLIATRLRSSGVTVVVHVHAVLAARDVLVLQFLLGALEQRAVEDAAFGQADACRRLSSSCLLSNSLEPATSIWRDRRPLLHRRPPARRRRLRGCTSLKKPVCEQQPDRCGRLLVRHRVADLDRQVAEDGSGLGALDALDADVLDLEGFEGLGGGAYDEARSGPATRERFIR